jgi:hypothetical protein
VARVLKVWRGGGWYRECGDTVEGCAAAGGCHQRRLRAARRPGRSAGYGPCFVRAAHFAQVGAQCGGQLRGMMYTRHAVHAANRPSISATLLLGNKMP